ncbi:MAG TPA: 2,3-bisphosphoglycerate-dependent phosphoglycerate mutase, partial [Gammaproteobacteria bacterium]|nr:2,3-bisphosphoglycerate-dependent phosphoglycerate mutase [Gammaproteobacteria bacterium]
MKKNTRPEVGQLVLVRHGQSDWNQKNLFTGWTDVDLTAQGRDEARQAGRTLEGGGFKFDIAFTSVLVRAIRTLWLILDEMQLTWIPVQKSWRLNERHYGALQGLDKAQTTAKHGAEQVKIWRRSYDIPPPPLDPSDERHPSHDPRYAALAPTVLPGTESLKTTLARVQPYWEDRIAPQLLRGRGDRRRVAHILRARGHELGVELVEPRHAGGDVELGDLVVGNPLEHLHERAQAVAVRGHEHV